MHQAVRFHLQHNHAHQPGAWERHLLCTRALMGRFQPNNNKAQKCVPRENRLKCHSGHEVGLSTGWCPGVLAAPQVVHVDILV
jgi:hypothetical protein